MSPGTSLVGRRSPSRASRPYSAVNPARPRSSARPWTVAAPSPAAGQLQGAPHPQAAALGPRAAAARPKAGPRILSRAAAPGAASRSVAVLSSSRAGSPERSCLARPVVVRIRAAGEGHSPREVVPSVGPVVPTLQPVPADADRPGMPGAGPAPPRSASLVRSRRRARWWRRSRPPRSVARQRRCHRPRAAAAGRASSHRQRRAPVRRAAATGPSLRSWARAYRESRHSGVTGGSAILARCHSH